MLTRSRLTVAVVVAGLALLIAGNALAATETHIDQEPAVGGPAPPPGSGVSLSVPQFGHAVDFTVCFLTGISAQVNQGNLMLDFTANALSKVTVVYTYLPASINIEKSTNGEDADSQTGPLVPVGDQVTWVYLVENTGEIALDPVAVTDDVLGPVTTCLKTALAPAETTTCTVMGTAVAGQYGNTGTATGTAVGTDLEVMDTDPSHYFGETVVCPPDRGKHDGMGHKKGGKKFWLLG
ncbi:MAG: hypothetical protein ACE5EV_03030, partial [Gaiellales bacterium]